MNRGIWTILCWLHDLNLINYYATANTKDLSDEVVSRTLAYSDTIKTIFNNTNFTYEIDFRAGSLYSQFETSAFGGLIVKFDGVMYFTSPHIACIAIGPQKI